jgi:hypothetical protein
VERKIQQANILKISNVIKLVICFGFFLILADCNRSPEMATRKKVASFLKDQFPMQRRLFSDPGLFRKEIKYWFGFDNSDSIKLVNYPSISKYFPNIRIYKAALLTGTFCLPSIEVYVVASTNPYEKLSLVVDPMTAQIPFSFNVLLGRVNIKNKAEAEVLSSDIVQLIQDSTGAKYNKSYSWLDFENTWGEAHRRITYLENSEGKRFYEIDVSFNYTWEFQGVSLSPVPSQPNQPCKQ